jgi:hypothetical protein
MRRLALAIAFAAPAVAARAQEVAVAVVEATGEAAITQGNRQLARDRATEDALRRAVEQAAGTLVASESEVRGSQLVSDRILTQARGYVQSYDVLDTREAAGAVQVKVRAKVGKDKLASDLAAIGLTLQRKGMPRIALLVAEQRIDEVKPAAWWGNQSGRGAAAGGLKVDQRIAENTLVAAWQPDGFTFVDMDALAGRVRVAGVVTADLSAETVREIKDLSGCDVVVHGSAVAVKEHDVAGMAEQISGLLSKVTGATCTATISVRAYSADNGEILAASEGSASSYDKSPLACGRDATAKATREMAADLKKKLLATWSKQLDQGTRLSLHVTGVETLGQLNALIAALQDGVRGVKSVQQRRFQGGEAELDAVVQGKPEAFAAALEERVVKGKRIEVTGLSANKVELRLVR